MASPGDEAVLAALHARVFPESPWDQAFWNETLIRPYDHGVLIGEPPRGFALVRIIGGEAEILTLGTQVPRQGDGTTLLAAVVRIAVTHGAGRLFLEVSARNTGALMLYERAGFQSQGVRSAYYQDGSDAAVMCLDLRA